MTGNTFELMRYEADEIISTLLILSSDLSARREDELVDFAEQVEEVMNINFTANYLSSLKAYWPLDEFSIEKLIELKNLITPQYSSQWHTKLREGNSEVNKAKQLAKSILSHLNIQYVDPIKFAEDHFDVDW